MAAAPRKKATKPRKTAPKSANKGTTAPGNKVTAPGTHARKRAAPKKAAPATRGRPPGKARKRPARSTIALIKSAKIVNRLQRHIDSTVKSPVNYMLPSQVTAALGLLKKTMPDLASAKVVLDATVQVEVLKVASHKAAK